MQRLFILVYGLSAYALFLICVVATIGFIGGLYGKTIDSGPSAPVWLSALVNFALIGAFGLHHSVAARPGIKARLMRLVPPAAERSTYVLVASVLLLLLIWQWQPIGGVLWHLEGSLSRALVYAVYAGGWVLVFVSTFLINHWELFGVSQVLRRWRDRPEPVAEFRLPLLYRLVRHPMHTGAMIMVEVCGFNWYRIRDGKIESEWEQTDSLDMLIQIGIVPADPSPGAGAPQAGTQ